MADAEAPATWFRGSNQVAEFQRSWLKGAQTRFHGPGGIRGWAAESVALV